MNCKPGDLAIIIGSDFTENLGRYVSVGANYLPYDERWGIEYRCTSIGQPLLYWRGTRKVTKGAMEIVIADRDLRPINPPTESQTTDEKEGMTA